MRPRTLIAALVALALLGAVAFGGYTLLNMLTKQALPWTDHCAATSGDWTVRLDPAQARNAAIIAGVAGRRGLPTQAVTIALATAYQESGIRNLDYGDRDSLGLFQQRPSQGWGTAAQVQDAYYSSNAFYAAMVQVKNWQTMDVGDVAQAVQRSGFPDAYDKHVTNAGVLANALSGAAPATFSCSSRATATADPAGLKQVLVATLSKKAVVDSAGTTVTVTMPDATAAWSAAHIAIAFADTYGVKSVAVADKTWSTGLLGGSWGTASTPAKANQVVITLA
ncbi:MAG TPA: hypothetical protein PKG79_03665 [Propioniciclava tarda]|nr:hypothetical protein [Propioniciclava tarda]